MIMIDDKYYAWKVIVNEDFNDAARVGFSLDGGSTLKKYKADPNDEEERYTKFMWILGSDYCETPGESIWGNVIPCKSLPNKDPYEGLDELRSSGIALEECLEKLINLSLSPDAGGNTFYVLYPKDKTLTQSSYQQFRYEIDGYGMGGDPLGGNFSKKLGEIYEIEPVRNKTIKITNEDGTEMTLCASKVTLSGDSYYGHEDVLSTFTIDNGGNDENQTTIRLKKGMNITLKGNTEGVAYFNSNVEFSQKMMGITPDSELSFTEQEEGRSSAFYNNACAEVNEEGQGRFIEMNLELKPGYVLEKITNENEEIAYVGLRCQYYTLLDEAENEVMGDDF